MAGIFDIGLSGLKTFQRALTLTSQNIANVNTPGYSRREIVLSELSADLFGNGVSISGIRRVVDEVASENLRATTSAQSMSQTYLDNAQPMQSYLDNENTSLSKALDAAFNSLQDLNSNPSSSSARSVYLSQLDIVTDRFKQLSNRINDNQSNINRQFQQIAKDVTDISSQIANINDKLSNLTEDQQIVLLDQRDQLLQKLSEKIPFRTVKNQDNSINVYIGTGNPLVVGTKSSRMYVTQNPDNPGLFDLNVQDETVSLPVTDFITQGQAGGLIAYQNDILQPMLNQLGQLALNVTDVMNQQNKLGMDLNGNLGSTLLYDINDPTLQSARVLPNLNNAGTSTMSVQIDNAQQITTSDYQLVFSGGNNYTLTRLSDNAAISSGTVGGFPASITGEGFTINVQAGTFSAGDTYTISPTRNAAAQFGLITHDPAKIALASPVYANAATQNAGTGYISSVDVVDTTNSAFSVSQQLNPPIQIQFLSSTSYQLVNANNLSVIEGPITFNPNGTNDIFPTPGSYDPGYRIQIEGQPATGDVFNINYNRNGIADNSNGLKFQDAYNKRYVSNSQMSFNESYNNLISGTAVKINAVSISNASNKAVMEQAQATRDSVSGVNLDEETVNMLQYEKAYQASASVISSANRMMQILLDITRG